MKALHIPRKLKKGLKKAFFTRDKIEAGWNYKDLKILKVRKNVKKNDFYVQYKGTTLTSSILEKM